MSEQRLKALEHVAAVAEVLLESVRRCHAPRSLVQDFFFVHDFSCCVGTSEVENLKAAIESLKKIER